MRTGYNHTKTALSIIVGMAALLVIVAFCVTWVYVEIAVGVSMLQIHEPFLGWSMLVIAASNVIGGLIWIGRATH